MRHQIMVSGEKIKMLRDKYGLNQTELAGGEVTRQAISSIENGKKKLSDKMAKLIVTNINNILAVKGFKNEVITVEYLTESLKVQANRLADEYISELDDLNAVSSDENSRKKDFNKDKFKEIKGAVESFLLKYDTVIDKSKAYEINYLMTEGLINIHSFEEAYIYAFKTYDISISLNDAIKQLKVIAKKITIYYRLNRNDEILALGKHALEIANKNHISDYKELVKIYYNLALAYKKNNNYTECLKHISLLLSVPGISFEDAISGKILRANCSKDLKRYNEAEKMYNDILNELKTNNQYKHISFIYDNLAAISLEVKDYDKAKYYAEKLVMIEYYNDEQNADNFYWAVYIYKELDEYEEVKKYYSRGLKYLKKINNLSGYNDLAAELIAYFISNNHKERILEIANLLINDSKSFGSYHKIMLIGNLYKILLYTKDNFELSLHEKLSQQVALIDTYNK